MDVNHKRLKHLAEQTDAAFEQYKQCPASEITLKPTKMPNLSLSISCAKSAYLCSTEAKDLKSRSIQTHINMTAVFNPFLRKCYH
jgi:hypothetical protein